MANKNTRESKAITTAEALEILEKRKKDGDMGYEQQVSYDHIKKFSKLENSKATKLIKQLKEFGISDKTSIQIVDVFPIDELQLKQILSNEKTMPDEETIKKIFILIEEHKGKA
ncbi:MAG: RNA polymerase Rpb4 family protein [Candidatus Micrarchaeaceae archaeon]